MCVCAYVGVGVSTDVGVGVCVGDHVAMAEVREFKGIRVGKFVGSQVDQLVLV
jgi:hypothetical protein